MLGVFLLLAFTCLGHECQDLLSPCDGMHVCTDLGVYSHPKEFLGTHVNCKGKIHSTGKIFLRGELNLHQCIKQDSEPNTLPAELFRPLCII